MFDTKIIEKTVAFYSTIDRWQEIQNFRKLSQQVGKVKNIFYGDSITQSWPLYEFFPEYNLINRGIAGDNVHGLYYRLKEDVLTYSPQRVFMMIGINGIDNKKNVDYIKSLASIIQTHNIEVFLCSLLPLRFPDSWDRFQYQDKIIKDNYELKQWSNKNINGFIDYHTEMKDETGQLDAEYAQSDGTHLNFAGYQQMTKIVHPYLLK